MRTTGPDTRRRILDAAYDLFYRGGFARAGVDAIAKAAGVTQRTLYYHFESKDALVAAVLDVQHDLALVRIRRWAARDADDPVALANALFDKFAPGAAIRPGTVRALRARRSSTPTCPAMLRGVRRGDTSAQSRRCSPRRCVRAAWRMRRTSHAS